MVKVYPLTECIARPRTSESAHLLLDHLQQVAELAVPERRTIEQELSFLAALLHDIGKSHAKWQDYIRKIECGQHLKSPIAHSPLGAALFALFGEHMIKQRAGDRLQDTQLLRHWMLGILDIANHHGNLDDLEIGRLPWGASGYEIGRARLFVDWQGIAHFLSKWFPELLDFLSWDSTQLETWEMKFLMRWDKLVNLQKSNKSNFQSDLAQAAFQSFRLPTGNLIFADRFDAGTLEGNLFDSEQLESGITLYQQVIAQKRQEFSASSLSHLREMIRVQAIASYKAKPDKPFYTLHVPTGTGKTMAALGVALEACKKHGKQRIIYAAPYLSIVSQVVDEIRQATGMEVMQHHSLTWQPENEKEEQDEKSALLMESWQAPIVVTSFNQLFAALFPSRAQQALRIPALKDAILILDEPQIIESAHWKVFLYMLEAASVRMNLQVILVTATMPPYQGVLSSPIHPLAPVLKKNDLPSRYQIEVKKEDWSEREVAEHLLQSYSSGESAAVILNTVQDAALVYQEISRHTSEGLFLCGAMTPLHKQEILQKVKARLKDRIPTLLVSTQVIEAGVDVSFDHLFRAASILPSVLQSAGRINRHGFSGHECGKLTVFRFLRHGEIDTRKYVYKSMIGRKVTDDLLEEGNITAEPDLVIAVENYYRELERRIAEPLAFKLADSAVGEWSSLAGLAPFQETNYHISTFVPYGEHLLLDSVRRRMDKFECSTIEEIYEKYEAGFADSLSFLERKQFFGLMQLFLVSVSRKMAGSRAYSKEGKSIWRLGLDGNIYHPDLGLAHLVGHEDEALFL
ncbi:CRISPR-associated helicase/endonuclease Cas3 [Effusibacillus lacus]|uniref:CRISPR-associated helicase/endonuclease Cas3 n=1 Tax=Effusibacillus lacus TaxID=1348429 RepID=A0A292YL80_9BACL|nr:CRISPR-associated helicase/endonuclease Cas3 [Effusibacillus lacus]TCS68781.1 CRISPR-associated Cas3 family helicase [Effusibacillus lacus]GAX90698.1 CRISPR-associated helicase/endonuclease Cas3 [Effusibacillus lacus]